MPFVKTHGLDVYYELHGSEYDRPIALVHHDGLTSDVWRPLLPHLTQDFHVLLFDRPGHGRSSVPPVEPTMSVERSASVMDGVFAAVGFDEPILFGASGGALIALEFALQNPRRVPLLIFGEPPLHGLAKDFPIERCGYSAARFREVFAQEGMEATVRAFLGTMFAPSRVNQILRSSGGRAMVKLEPHVLLQALTTDEEYCPGDRLRDVPCMTIVLTGENSSLLFKSVERVLATQIPYCMPVRLPRADHASLLSPTPHLLRALGAIATTSTATESSTFSAVESGSMTHGGLQHLAASVQRVRVKDFGTPISISFTVPFTDETVRREVVDISSQGLAFKTEDEDSLVPGLILPLFAIELPHTTVLARGIIRRVRLTRRMAGVEITTIAPKDKAILSAFVDELGRTTISYASRDDLPNLPVVLDATGASDAVGPATAADIEQYCAFRIRALSGDAVADDRNATGEVPKFRYEEDDDEEHTSVASVRASRPPETYPCLVVIGGTRNIGKTFRVKHGATIGRAFDCDVVLDEAGVSRLHAKVRIAKDGVYIDDCGSTHGIYHRGMRTASAPARDGDRIQVGDAAVTIVRMDASAPLSGRPTGGRSTSTREANLPSGDLLLLVARNGETLEGTAELVRERGATWLLQNVGVLPTSRLAPQELLAELLELATHLPNFSYVRSLLRIEQDEAIETLMSVSPDRQSVTWRKWFEMIEASPRVSTEISVRALGVADSSTMNALLDRALDPLERAALCLSEKELRDPSPLRQVLVASHGTQRLAWAIRDGVPQGMHFAGPSSVVRILAADASAPAAAAVARLAQLVLADAAGSGRRERVLVQPQFGPALADAGFTKGPSWVEAVAGRTAAVQMTNFYAILT